MATLRDRATGEHELANGATATSFSPPGLCCAPLLPLAGIALLTTPYARTLLEQFMLTHVLVQLPLLILCGWWFARELSGGRPHTLPYHYALPLLTGCLIVAMLWMLPRMLDASLEQPAFTALKFISLPFFLGLPLFHAWKNVGPISQAFFIAHLLSMAVVLAWLYIEAPVRLCNYYLLDEQHLLGDALLCVAGATSLYWAARLFVTPGQERQTG